MTRGGPTYSTEVFATMLYRHAFDLNEMGVASALAVIMVLVCHRSRPDVCWSREGGQGEDRRLPAVRRPPAARLGRGARVGRAGSGRCCSPRWPSPSRRSST